MPVEKQDTAANGSGSMRATTAASDGRARRSARSHDAIVDAMFALVGDGVVQPTARQIADHAGVGMRSVFRHFAEP